jgi:hypothetical protein
MELPIEALKMVSEFIPVEGEKNHHLIWTPDNGFILYVWVGEKAYRMSFNYDDNINSIKEELQNLTGIPMPEQEKKEEKTMDTPMLDGIKRGGFVHVDRNTLQRRVGKSKFTPELMEEILLSNDEDIFSRALSRQDIPKELLVDLSFSPLKRIRSLVRQHPNLPEVSLRRMQGLSKKSFFAKKQASKNEEKIMDTPKLSEIRKIAYGTLGTASGQAALQSALGRSQRAASNVAPAGRKTMTQVEFMLSPQYHKATKRTAGTPFIGKRILRGIVGGPRKAKAGY